jgi:hypothetical protein
MTRPITMCNRIGTCELMIDSAKRHADLERENKQLHARVQTLEWDIEILRDYLKAAQRRKP